MYHDELVELAEDYGEFMDVLAKHHATQKMQPIRLADLKVISGEKRELFSGIPEEVIEDTENHTGLYFLLPDGQVIPTRSWPILSMESSAGIRQKFHNDQTHTEMAEIFNKNILPKRGKAERKLVIEDGKVSGIVTSKYALIPAEDVYTEAQFFLDGNFPEAVFVDGMYTHSIVTASWDLSEHAGEFEDVTDGLPYKPFLTVTTSDTGESSVTIRPYACTDHATLPIEPIRVPHRGDAEKCAEEVTAAFESAYAMIRKGIADIEALKKVALEHPENAMLKIAQKHKLPKEHALNAIETFMTVHGDVPATAYACFTALCEVIQMERKVSREQSFNTEDRLCRCLADNWKSYDKPGKMSW